MSLTQQQARAEIFERIDNVWTTATTAQNITAELRFQGVPEGALPGAANYWGRVSTQTVRTIQSAHIMSDQPGASPAEFTNYGLVFVQVFAPKEIGAYEIGENIAEALKQCFMATHTPGGVWFRNPSYKELSPEDQWYRWNVVAEYQYPQIKDP